MLEFNKEFSLLQKYFEELTTKTGITDIYYDDDGGSKHDFLIPEEKFNESLYKIIHKIHADIFTQFISTNPTEDDQTLLSIIVIDMEYINTNNCVLVEEYLKQHNPQDQDEYECLSLLDLDRILDEIYITKWQNDTPNVKNRVQQLSEHLYRNLEMPLNHLFVPTETVELGDNYAYAS